MSFAFPLLLGGLAALAIPVVLHFLFRERPKTVLFPAFQFLLQKKRANQRSLKLRHLLLLLLRIGLILGIVFALARTRFHRDDRDLTSDNPVSLILVVDVSPSMEYRAGETLLDLAKQKAQALLDKLPAGSRICVAGHGKKPTWLDDSLEAKRIVQNLAIDASQLSLAKTLQAALPAWSEAPLGHARLLCIFSDRAQNTLPETSELLEKIDAVPPSADDLKRLQARLPKTLELIENIHGETRASLIEALKQLQSRADQLDARPLPTSIVESVRHARRATRGLLEGLSEGDPNRKVLAEIADDVRGFRTWWFDVRVPAPRDLVVGPIEFPGGVRLSGLEDVELSTTVRALGEKCDTMVSRLGLGERKDMPLSLAEGETRKASIVLDLARQKLKDGVHSLELRAEHDDPLPASHRTYASFWIPPTARVLLIAESAESAAPMDAALRKLQYDVSLHLPVAGKKLDLTGIAAVVLLGAARPDPAWWPALEAFVRSGRNLLAIPGGEEMDLARYAGGVSWLPGVWTKTVDAAGAKEPRVIWALRPEDVEGDTPLAPMRGWMQAGNIGFLRLPEQSRGALKYWEVQPAKESRVLVRYKDDSNRPALLQRSVGLGRVIQWTTPMDAREPAWHNYRSSPFYLSALYLMMRYLVAEAKSQTPTLNFSTAEASPSIWLPPDAPAGDFTLLRDSEKVQPRIKATFENGALTVGRPLPAGNYSVRDARDVETARFSVNVPIEEFDLTPIPEAKLESLFGSGCVMPIDRQTSFGDLLAQRLREPTDLTPYLLLFLIVLLAGENWLSNRFYRREPAGGAP